MQTTPIRVTATSSQEALVEVRDRLGDDAVILETRRLLAGGVEVLAASASGPAPAIAETPRRSRRPIETADAASDAGESDLWRSVQALQALVQELSRVDAASARSGLPTPKARQALALMERGLSEQTADSLLRDPGGARSLPEIVAQAVRCAPHPLDTRQGDRQLVALVGPTGVGKTTLIAKLAAEAVMERDARVALVTVDTWRVNAVEHLRRYAQILDLPFQVVASPAALGDFLRRNPTLDHVLIDTDGRSPREPDRLDELSTVLSEACSAAGEVAVHLVLSATTAAPEMLAAFRAFEGLQPRSTLFTKIDEATRYGAIVDYVAQSRHALSLLSAGARPPGELCAATPDIVSALVLDPEHFVLPRPERAAPAPPPAASAAPALAAH